MLREQRQQVVEPDGLPPPAETPTGNADNPVGVQNKVAKSK